MQVELLLADENLFGWLRSEALDRIEKWLDGRGLLDRSFCHNGRLTKTKSGRN